MQPKQVKNRKLLTQFFKAVGTGNIKQVKKMVQKKKLLVNSRLNFDVCPLHLSAEKGYIELFKYLLSQGGNITLKNNFGWSVVHFAAFNNKCKMLIFILEYLKKYPKIKLTIDERNSYNGFTPLHECLQNGLYEPMKILLEYGANFELKTTEGQTSQELAALCTTKKMDCLNYLVSKMVEKRVNKKEEEFDILKSELKKHLSLTTEENTRLREKIQEQKKINDLINKLEESKKKEIDLNSKNMQYEEFFKEEQDLNFFMHKFRELIRRVTGNQEMLAQKKISQLFFDEHYFSIIAELNKDRKLMGEYVAQIETKFEKLEERKKEYMKLKGDNLVFLKTIFFFNHLKHNDEKSFKNKLELYESITKELVAKRKKYKKFKFSFNLKNLNDDDDEEEEGKKKEVGMTEIQFHKKTRIMQNEILLLQRRQEQMKKLLFAFSECHTKLLFVNYLKKQVMSDFSRETIQCIPKQLLDNWGFLNVLSERTLEDYYDITKIGENIFTAKLINPLKKNKNEIVYLKLFSLQHISESAVNEVSSILSLYRYTEEKYLQNILSIRNTFIFENQMLAKQMCIEIERVESTLAHFFKNNRRELITKQDIKCVFKPIFETIQWLHSKNIILRTLSNEKVFYNPLTGQIKISLFNNVKRIVIGKNEQLQEVYRLDVFSFFGRMLYSALIKELKITEFPSVKHIDLQTDLSIMEKKFLKDLAEHKNERDIIKSGRDFFNFSDSVNELEEEINMPKLTNLDTIRKSYNNEENSVAQEVELEYDLFKFLDLWKDQILSCELLREYKINGQTLPDIADQYLSLLFSPKLNVLNQAESSGLYLPSDQREYAKVFKALGRFFCKCVMEGIQLESFKKFHRLFYWLLIKNEQQLTHRDYVHLVRLYNPSYLTSLNSLNKLDPNQLERLNIFYDMSSSNMKIEKKRMKAITKLTTRMLAEHLFGKRGYRRKNLYHFKQGYLSCLTISQEKSLVLSLSVREMEHLTEKSSFSKDLEFENYLNSIRQISEKAKENICKFIKKESKLKNSVNYKLLMELIDHKDTVRLEIVSMFCERYEWIELKFPIYIRWDNYLNKNFVDPFSKTVKVDKVTEAFFETEEEKNPKIRKSKRLEKYLKENEILIHTFVHTMIEKYKGEDFKQITEFRVELFIFCRLFLENKCKLEFTMLQKFLNKGPFSTPSLYQFLAKEFYFRIKSVNDLNTKLNQKISKFHDITLIPNITLKHFKIEKKYRMDDTQDPYSESIRKFSTLPQAFTVRDKLRVLKESLDLIPTLLKKYYEKKMTEEERRNFGLGSDEIFPIFLFVVVKSKVRNLVIELKFLNDFNLEDCGPNSFALVNFESAIHYICDSVSLETMQKEHSEIEKAEQDVVDVVGI